jgi:hypothetical protein
VVDTPAILATSLMVAMIFSVKNFSYYKEGIRFG